MNHEEAKQVADQALASLAQELAAGRSQRLVEYLDVLGRFHHYSFGNALLIAFQKPDATHVAGFHAWKKFDRYVKKGEKGIVILAPLVYKRKAKEGEIQDAEKPKEVTHLKGFKAVYVFDVSQTDGKPLPEFARVQGDPGQFTERMKKLIAKHQIGLMYEDILSGALGKSIGGDIVLRPDLSPAVEFSVLVHEFAHEMLHKGDRRKETTQAIRETEAEAVAYAVSKAVGLDTSSAAADYIQLWNGTVETLADSLDHIQRISAEIISALLTNTARKAEEVPDAA